MDPALWELYESGPADEEVSVQSFGWSPRERRNADLFYADLMGIPVRRRLAPWMRAPLGGESDAELFFAELTGDAPPIRPAPWRRRAGVPEELAAARGEAADTRGTDPSATIRWAQQTLNRALGTSLTTNGLLGPATRTALQQFQQRRGLTPDHRLLGRTLRALAADSRTVPPSVWPGSPPAHQGRQPDLSVPCPGTPTVLDAFVFASATPTAAHRATIAQLAQAIVASQTSNDAVHLVCLEGHADSVGSNESNVVLGQRRSDAVKAELIAAVDRSSPGLSRRLGFWSTSAGETEPVAPNTTDANRAKNRRVVVHLNNRWQGSADNARVTVMAAGPAAGAEEPIDLQEQNPPQVFRIDVSRSLKLICTGSPLPVGTPAYTWVSADSTIASITQQGTAQTHPNRITVQALRPGTTTVSVTYRSATAGSATTTVTIVARAILDITRPAAQSVWVLLFEPEAPRFLTQGISQGATLWNAAGTPTVTHGDPANGTGDRRGAAGVKVRADERGLVVQGRVDASATGVSIRILSGTTNIPLKASPSATAANQLAATLAAPATGAATRDFEAVLFLDNPSSRFGRVQVRADSVGLATATTTTADVLLVGAQVALVNDRSSNIDGRTRGPIRTEADERFVIDFVASPQATLPLLTVQTRARRMIVDEIIHRPRALSATVATVVGKPEMPMWMAELQLVGVNATSLLAFLQARALKSLRVEAGWRLKTSWDGPNSAAGGTRPYRYSKEWTATTSARIALDTAGTAIDGLQTTGEVQNALTPAPTAPAFPVTGRRTAQFVASGVTRGWGQQSTATQLPAILVEHQPLLVGTANREIMRGGDGELELTSLSIDGTAVDPGRIANATGTTAPPANTPLAMLPTFRVKGVNLPAADRRALVDALVNEFVIANATDAWVAMLTLAQWQTTTWLILQHESIGGMQFDERVTGRRAFRGLRFGNEQDMPICGPPAGYGWGQLDSPPVTDDGAWSFADNVRAAIDLLIGQKARGAHGAMSAHFPTPIDRLARAAFRRETVRRYNGSREFQWNGATWEINPTLPRRDSSGNPNGNLGYPNAVLGTSIVYFTGTGATAVFPWPIAFPPAQFGPGI